jgi:hypothetical protein
LTPRLTALPLVLLLLSPLHAQTSPTTATLHGTVVNSVTHQPIARALVSLDQYSQATLTDNEGRFTFDNIPAGQTTLSAKRPGYASDDSGATNHDTVTVGADADLTLQLVPQSSITGELIFPNDDAPDSIQVQLLHQEIQNGRGHWATYRNAETTSLGRFRFGNLPAGSYLVHVAASLDPAPAQPRGSNRPRSGYVPAFYPGVRDIAGAGVIHLTPGQQADVKMELTREPYYPVAIPVANFEEARGIGFEVSSDSFLGLPARFSPQDGQVHIDLPAGHYLLEAQGFGQRPIAGEKEFDVNPDSGSVSGRAAITLLPGNRIPVTVHAEFTHTLQTADASRPAFPTAANQISLTLQRDGNGAAIHGRTPNLQDDASGISYLTGVAPGKYWVNVRPFNGYVAAITSGGVDLLEHPLTVAPDGSASPIDVTLRDDTASLSAALASSLQPTTQGTHPALYLQLIPQSGPAVARTVPFAADGTANLSDLPPGNYLALASTSHRQIEYRDPTVIAALAGKGQSVSVEAGGAAHITVDSLLDPLAEASGSAL